VMHQTHHAGGLIAAEIVLIYYHQPVFSWITPAALLGGYFLAAAADVDKPESYVGQKVLPISLALQTLRIRHRTLTHSLLFTGVLWLLLKSSGLPNVLVVAWVAAYASHWFLDLFNEQGVELTWPLPFRIKFLPSLLAVGTDSWAEVLIRQALYGVHYVLFFVLVKPLLFDLPIVGQLFSNIWAMLLSSMPHFISRYL